MRIYISCMLASTLFLVDLGAQIAPSAEEISPLLISEKVPDIDIVTLEGEKISLMDIVSDKSAVVIFYRGGWCPYCNSHLSEVSLIESEILDLGYQIVAISPDAPNRQSQTINEVKLNYQLYSDADGKLMREMGIAFKAPERYSDRLSDYSDGLNDGVLPVPSVFVVDQEGIILFEYISPDYRQRISADLLLAVLESLENTSGP